MNFLENYTLWIEKTKDDAPMQKALQDLALEEEKLKESFYKELEFGTAGLRGVLGPGTNRMNLYTVGKATQGFANYLNDTYPQPKLAISYDSRNQSAEFALHIGKIMAANGITVYLSDTLAPTPFLSYMVRNLGCSGGVMVTASHNPYIYNGYKVYDHNGCQLTDRPANLLTEYVNKVDFFQDVRIISKEEAMEKALLHFTGESLLNQYIDAVFAKRLIKEGGKGNLKVVFTPLNGAGNISVQKIIEKVGGCSLSVVKEQEFPDGNFPTCPYPNPEEKEALQLGLDLAKKTQGDILLATDPDSDRVGVALLDGTEFKILTGNEIGLLLLDFIITQRKLQGTMPKHPIVFKTIVSSALVNKICHEQGIDCVDLLTGFKYIGAEIEALSKKGEEENFIFGYEESFGYLTDGFVRDKDAVLAAMHIVQMAQVYKENGWSLLDKLEDIYQSYGYLINRQKGYGFEGISGMNQMEEIMANLRETRPTSLGEFRVTEIKDYLKRERYVVDNEEKTPIALPKANVIEFILQEGSSIIIRPSGTEPKVKAYLTIFGNNWEETKEKEEKLLKIANNMMKI